MNEAYEKELVLSFEKEIGKYTAHCVQKDMPFEHGVSVVVTALAFVLCSTMVSVAHALKMDQEKFSIFINDIVNKIKRFANDMYEGKDNESKSP